MPKKATVVKLFSEEHANTVFVALGTQLGPRSRNGSDFEIHLNTLSDTTNLLFKVVEPLVDISKKRLMSKYSVKTEKQQQL